MQGTVYMFKCSISQQNTAHITHDVFCMLTVLRVTFFVMKFEIVVVVLFLVTLFTHPHVIPTCMASFLHVTQMEKF